MSECISYHFVFPRVLKELKYASDIRPEDHEAVEVADCREVIRRYFTEMTDGAKYERGVNEPWNTSSPHCLTSANFQTARLIRAMGFREEDTRQFVDRLLPELECIPPWADLFDSAIYDEQLGTLIDVLNGQRGFQIANACKVLYQKRPRLVPILDQYARQAFHVPWEDGDIITPAVSTIREVSRLGMNQRTLAGLRDWLFMNPDVTGGIPLSTVRILDILAWFVIRQRRDSEL